MTSVTPIPDVPECEAERRNVQALHAMEVDWGAGIFDYGKIKGILTGRDNGDCDGELR
ncbi:hypothetical protein QFZ61_002081 [Arthrobacter sp. B3I4]|nr:hypothetical protein [Arthrobacter sp. B3I4]